MNTLKNYYLNDIEHYKVWGRTDNALNPLPLFWTGSGIELNVSGSELWIDVEVSYDTFEPWIAYNIEGSFISRQALQRGLNSVCVYANRNAAEIKNVFFYKETQPFSDDADHSVHILSIKSDGQFYPVSEKTYRLEFIGDSITSGEGTYGAVNEEDWLPMFLSASKNYAVQTAQLLNAEYRILSQSGWGIYAGWDNNLEHNMPQYCEQICGLAKGIHNEQSSAFKPHDFSSWKPDAVIINLGTNDVAAMKHYTDPSVYLNKLSISIGQFLQCIRKNNPHSVIIWVYGMIGNDLETCIKASIQEYNFMYKDKVHYLSLPDTLPENLGSRKHPGADMHTRVSLFLRDYLIPLLPPDHTGKSNAAKDV